MTSLFVSISIFLSAFYCADCGEKLLGRGVNVEKLVENYNAWYDNSEVLEIYLIKKKVSQIAFFLRMFKRWQPEYNSDGGEAMHKIDNGSFWRFHPRELEFHDLYNTTNCFTHIIPCIEMLHEEVVNLGDSSWWFKKQGGIKFDGSGVALVSHETWREYTGYVGKQAKLKKQKSVMSRVLDNNILMQYYFCCSIMEELYFCDLDPDYNIDDSKATFKYKKDCTNPWGTKDFKCTNKLVKNWDCTTYSFCPDPCCGRRFQKEDPKTEKYIDKCQVSMNNPCRKALKDDPDIVDTTCTYDARRNRELPFLMNNMFNVNCMCSRNGFQFTNIGEKDEFMCVDVDECHEQTHNCKSEYCINTVGSYVCACHFGHVRTSQGKCVKIEL